MIFTRTLVLVSLLGIACSVFADGERDNAPTNVRRIPKAGVAVPADREASLRSQLDILQSKIAELNKSKDPGVRELLPDVMIYERAIRCALDYDEFFSTKDINKADELATEGIARADQLIAGNPKWPRQSGLVVRGYISRIDNTVQPYGLVIPESYAFNHSVPTRCDLWFHGRGETLSEVNFIHGRMKSVGQYAPEHTIVLHPYGRYSNAFKFAGETDVLEALEDVQKRYRIDEDRISVRGFSMGGAACWQFAVHYADRWFAANPGAGFSETPQFLKFFQKETLHPNPWEKKLWNLYDCNKYALNLVHCPTIAYSGENDIQKQAADVMETALKEHNIRLRHVVGAKMGHRIDNPSKLIIEAGLKSLASEGRQQQPRHLVLKTYTLKYNKMHSLTIDGLKEHWKQSTLHVNIPRDFGGPAASTDAVKISASNVSAFTLRFPAGTFPGRWHQNADTRIHALLFDGDLRSDTVVLRGNGVYSDGSAVLQAHLNADNKWVSGSPPAQLSKCHGLQGPIDDAFMDSFIFVRPTGKATNELVGKWSASELERAIVHWRRHFRGDARVVNDIDVTEEMIASANLILWGDASSNSLIAKVENQLPITWSDQEIRVGDNSYDASHHVPILIYPNPLNQDRYVVLNSSFTFRDYAYLNNARQVPMLPDWAIVDLKTPPGNVWPGEVVAADFFDEEWKLKQ